MYKLLTVVHVQMLKVFWGEGCYKGRFGTCNCSKFFHFLFFASCICPCPIHTPVIRGNEYVCFLSPFSFVGVIAHPQEVLWCVGTLSRPKKWITLELPVFQLAQYCVWQVNRRTSSSSCFLRSISLHISPVSTALLLRILEDMYLFSPLRVYLWTCWLEFV